VSRLRQQIQFGQDLAACAKAPDAGDIHAADPHGIGGKVQSSQNVFAQTGCCINDDVLELLLKLVQQV
jgi:hypothetical protein